MAFAPPRPQSIFGRAAPPSTPIDYRLGAQVGPNIASGIQTAVAGVTKGWEKYQAAKLKKANQEGAEQALKGMGADPEDAKAFSKFPEATKAFTDLRLAQRKVGAYEDSLKKQTAAARRTSLKQIHDRQDKVRADVEKMIPSLMTKVTPAGGGAATWQLDPFAMQDLTPEQNAALKTIPHAVQARLAEDDPDLGAATALMSIGGTINQLTAGQKTAYGEMSEAQRATIEGQQVVQFVSSTTMLPSVGGQPPQRHPLATSVPAGTVLAIGKDGQIKAQIPMDNALQRKIDVFTKEIQKIHAGYKLTEGDIYNLTMGRKTQMDLRELSALATKFGMTKADIIKLLSLR